MKVFIDTDAYFGDPLSMFFLLKHPTVDFNYDSVSLYPHGFIYQRFWVLGSKVLVHSEITVLDDDFFLK